MAFCINDIHFQDSLTYVNLNALIRYGAPAKFSEDTFKSNNVKILHLLRVSNCVKNKFPISLDLTVKFEMTGEGLIVFKFKGTVKQIEKMLTNDPLHVSKVSRKFRSYLR